MLCPYCKEEIADGAIKCKHCKSILGAASTPVSAPSIGSSQSKQSIDIKWLLWSSEGRLNRKPLWMLGLAVGCTFAILALILGVIFGSQYNEIGEEGSLLGISVALWILWAITLIIMYNPSIKRCQDRGLKSKQAKQVVYAFYVIAILNEFKGILIFRNQSDEVYLIITILSLVFGIVYFITLYCLRGTVGDNEHGKDPITNLYTTPSFQADSDVSASLLSQKGERESVQYKEERPVNKYKTNFKFNKKMRLGLALGVVVLIAVALMIVFTASKNAEESFMAEFIPMHKSMIDSYKEIIRQLGASDEQPEVQELYEKAQKVDEQYTQDFIALQKKYEPQQLDETALASSDSIKSIMQERADTYTAYNVAMETAIARYNDSGYGKVNWGMTVDEVRNALQSSERLDIQTNVKDYSKWFSGATIGISATHRPESGIELWELYLFKRQEDSSDRLVCMGFAAPLHTRGYVLDMLQGKYGDLVPDATNVKRQELLNLADNYVKREFGIQSKRTVGIVHTEQGQQQPRIDVTLVAAYNNK